MDTIGSDEAAYPQLVSLYQKENPAAGLSTPEDQKAFNDFTGKVNAQFGAETWADLPSDFASQYKPSQPANNDNGLFSSLVDLSKSFFSGNSMATDTALSGMANNNPFTGPVVSGAPEVKLPVVNTGSDLVSNILTGNNAKETIPGYSQSLFDQITGGGALARGGNILVGDGGTNISPWTYSPTTNNFTSDNSDRSTINYNSTNVLNDAGYVQNLLAGIKGFFGTPQAAISASPSNDAALVRGALAPGMYSVGQTVNADWSTPTSPNLKVGTLTGLETSTQANAQSNLYKIGLVVAVISLLFFIFRRGSK